MRDFGCTTWLAQAHGSSHSRRREPMSAVSITPQTDAAELRAGAVAASGRLPAHAWAMYLAAMTADGWLRGRALDRRARELPAQPSALVSAGGRAGPFPDEQHPRLQLRTDLRRRARVPLDRGPLPPRFLPLLRRGDGAADPRSPRGRRPRGPDRRADRHRGARGTAVGLPDRPVHPGPEDVGAAAAHLDRLPDDGHRRARRRRTRGRGQPPP